MNEQLGFNLAEAISNPKELLDTYKHEVIKSGTQALLVQAVLFSIIVYLIVDAKTKRG